MACPWRSRGGYLISNYSGDTSSWAMCRVLSPDLTHKSVWWTPGPCDLTLLSPVGVWNSVVAPFMLHVIVHLGTEGKPSRHRLANCRVFGHSYTAVHDNKSIKWVLWWKQALGQIFPCVYNPNLQPQKVMSMKQINMRLILLRYEKGEKSGTGDYWTIKIFLSYPFFHY